MIENGVEMSIRSLNCAKRNTSTMWLSIPQTSLTLDESILQMSLHCSFLQCFILNHQLIVLTHRNVFQSPNDRLRREDKTIFPILEVVIQWFVVWI